MPRLGPTESIISLRHAGPGRRRATATACGRRDDDADRGRPRGAVPALGDRVDRLPHDPQHGDGRRQPVRAAAARRPRRLPARARRAGREDGDLVTSVSFKVPERWFYTKAMRRKQNSASIVTVASDGVRIALGGVAPRAGARARGRGGARRGRHRRRGRGRRRGRRPVRRRVRQRLVPPSCPARPRPQSPSQCRLASSNSKSTASRRVPRPAGDDPAQRAARHARADRRQARLRRGTCGTCTCHVDGEAVHVLPGPGRDDQRRRRVKTLEGTTPADGLSPLQQAFLDSFATQCGFCTPGMIMAAEALLAENPNPTREDVVRRSPATSAAARATRASSTRSSTPRGNA